MKIIKAGECFRFINNYESSNITKNYIRIERIRKAFIYYKYIDGGYKKEHITSISHMNRMLYRKTIEHIPKIEAICLGLIKVKEEV
jgi:hypothetical protein